ncbi:P-loop containing nucleoside triphosphate hydrolase protein [Crucibulum laeve]|uniref:P-loop containing nucleoside triphosphate hydrolase protein n=1 Tax=Crucibulum laeve TaxID=68775 RepID=A0A5C3MD93_9AGAR|nr:P-loop containing nucleoside triphosphate hydrolase protein [Crucibulum laeve]
MSFLRCRSKISGWTLLKTLSTRRYASHSSHDTSKIRNMALVAHIDSGKTTLTESILLKSSYLSSSGSVDTGSTTTDFLPVERERGITIQSASIPVKWKDWTFNLIDTPGHADFGMEVESASRVVDGAVVLIDSVEGVESQTKGVWKQLDRYGVGTRIMFLNKLDRTGSSVKLSMESLLSNRLHPHPLMITLPIASFDPQDYAQAEPGIQGLVDLVKWELWKWNTPEDITRMPLPRTVDGLNQLSIIPAGHPVLPELVSARAQLLENLSMFSEELMEQLLSLPSDQSSYLGIEGSDIMSYLRKSSLSNEILPVLCGSAAKNIGTDVLMDYIGELLPSPLDVVHDEQSKNAPLRMLAWKVNWDKRRGWMTFVRIYSGTLTRQSNIFNTNQNQKERISKLLLLYASEIQEVDELPFGSVGVILGLKYTRTGDTLVSASGPASSRSILRDITPPTAVISASVIPQSHSDLEPVQEALESLSRTDPSVRVDAQEGQILVHGLGALHLEIVEGRLRDEWDVNFEFGRRRVSYREGLGAGLPSQGWEIWETDAGGKHITVSIPLDVRPLQEGDEGDPIWDGNLVLDEKGRRVPSPESMSTTPLAHVAEGIASALSNSPHSSLPLTHVRVQIKERPTSAMAPSAILTGATSYILRRRIREAGLGPVMEPYVHIKISVNESNLGKVVKDLTEHNGEVLDLGTGSVVGLDGNDDVSGYSENGVYIPPSWISPSGSASTSHDSAGSSRVKRSVHGLAPLSQFLDYSSRLRALSEGHGSFEMVNAGFRGVSELRKLEILKEIGRA